jgi:hypothetical protein
MTTDEPEYQLTLNKYPMRFLKTSVEIPVTKMCLTPRNCLYTCSDGGISRRDCDSLMSIYLTHKYLSVVTYHVSASSTISQHTSRAVGRCLCKPAT